jgi:hypothetical protein
MSDRSPLVAWSHHARKITFFLIFGHFLDSFLLFTGSLSRQEDDARKEDEKIKSHPGISSANKKGQPLGSPSRAICPSLVMVPAWWRTRA